MVKNIAIGTGRRKTATARVFVRDGSGKIVVNGKASEWQRDKFVIANFNMMSLRDS